MRRLLVALAGLTVALVVGLTILRLRRPTRTPRTEPERGPSRTLPIGSSLGRLMLVVVPTLTIAGGVFLVTLGAPWFLARQHFPSEPEQPIYFSHAVHVQEVGLDCAFCHRTADRADTASYPDVEQCMFCHLVVDENRAAQQAR